MKIGITGANGKVGRYLLDLGCLPLECDVTEPKEIERAIAQVKPDVIVHLAFKSNVNWCEDKINAPVIVNTNVRGTYKLCAIAERNKIPVLVISTDYIFSGRRGPYKESSNDFKPVNFYGISKVAAEQMAIAFKDVKIIRTSHLISSERLAPYIRQLQIGASFDAPTFLRRSFLHIRHFAKALHQCAQNVDNLPQFLHVSGTETVSWYNYLYEVAKMGGYDTALVQKRRHEIPSPARRAYKLGLVVTKARKLGIPLFSYKEGIEEVLENEDIDSDTNSQ